MNMKYENVWSAVDKLAKINGLSPSGLAKKAGLDSTTFNKSKRIRPDGKKRWPSLDSINKILEVCNMTFEQFYNLTNENSFGSETQNFVPYVKFSKIANNPIEDAKVVTYNWEKIHFPDTTCNIYSVEVDVDFFEPFYRRNTTLIISQNSEIRQGDRIVIMLKDGRVLINEFVRRTSSTLEVCDLLNKDIESSITIQNIALVNRIVWASQ